MKTKSVQHRRTALLLTGTIVLLIVVFVCISFFGWRRQSSPNRQHEQMAMEILERLRSLPASLDHETDDDLRMQQLSRLAAADRPTIVAFFRKSLDPETAGVENNLHPLEVRYLANIALGLDRDGTHSREIAEAYLVPALRRQLPSTLTVYLLDSERLHPEAKTARLLFDAELCRVENGTGPPTRLGHRNASYLALEVLRRNLDDNTARAFVPRLIGTLRKHIALASVLASMAPMLTCDESIRVAREIIGSRMTIQGELLPTMEAFLARLNSSQVASLVPDVLEQLRRQPLVHTFDNSNVVRFRLWSKLLGAMAVRLAPVESAQLGKEAAELMKAENAGSKLPALALALVPLLAQIDHDQLAPVLRPAIDALPSADENILRPFADNTVSLLRLADPRDVSSAARRMHSRLASDIRQGHLSGPRCESFAEWAPALAASDAFDFAQSFAREMVKMRAKHVVATLSFAVEKLSARLDSKQSLAIAHILVKNLSLDNLIEDHPGGVSYGDLGQEVARGFDEWMPMRLRYLVEVLARRLDRAALQSLVAGLRARIAAEKDAPTLAWLKDLLPSVEHPPLAPRNEGATAMATHEAIPGRAPAGTPDDIAAPAGETDVSPKVETLVADLFKARLPSKRDALIREIVQVTSAWRKPITLAAYRRAIPIQQLYVDLLKRFFVNEDDWKVLVRALQTTSGRPTESSLWEYVIWTEQDSSGRSLGLDWDSPPPQRATADGN